MLKKGQPHAYHAPLTPSDTGVNFFENPFYKTYLLIRYMDTLLERLVGLLHTFKAGEAEEEDGGERKVAFGAAPALRSTSHGAELKQVNRLFE